MLRKPLTIAIAVGFLSWAVLAVSPVFADGEGHVHGPGASSFDPELLSWAALSLAGVLAALVLSRLVLLREVTRRPSATGERVGYLTAIRSFSRNARLFLGYSLLAELGSGIWAVIFNLYLLRAGFPIAFIGTFWLVNMLCHGAAALPAGVIADRFGRRRAFFIATGISLLAQGALLFTVDPVLILALAGVAGFGEAFHGVTGAPFMMDNSEAEERPHLFSLNAAFLQVSRFTGNMAGGILPLLWATTVGLPALDPGATRWALVTGLPLTAIALVPLVFMREKPVELAASFKDMVTLRNVVNLGVIMRFTALSLMVGTGFGLTVRFFNVFFERWHQASDAQIGTVLGFGAFAAAGSVLIAPVLAQRWGKARSIWLTQSLSVPFLLLLAAVPSLAFATAIFLVRGALYSVGQPLRNQLSMEFVDSGERGTAAGFTHTAFDLGGGLGAGLAGLLITNGDFAGTFAVAALLIAVPAYLYYAFFDGMESRKALLAPVEPAFGRADAGPTHRASLVPRWFPRR